MRFHPSGRLAEVAPGTSLYDAARSVGLPVGSACAAEGICGRCGLVPLDGAASLSPETDAERRVKVANRVEDAARLSCVARVWGDVVVTARYW